MADTIQITSNARELVENFRNLLPSVQTGVANGLKGALLELEGMVQTRAGVKARRGAAGLFGRLTSYVDISGAGTPNAEIDGAIGFRKTRGFPYELSHEFGAKAKPGGAMTVPISSQAKSASGRGIDARTAFAGRKMVVIRTMGKAFLVETIRTRSILHYVLIKSLPATLHFRDTVLGAVTMISDRIEQGAAEGMAKA